MISSCIYFEDRFAERLQRVLENVSYFQLHPAPVQPIIKALVAMRAEAEFAAPAAGAGAPCRRRPLVSLLPWQYTFTVIMSGLLWVCFEKLKQLWSTATDLEFTDMVTQSCSSTQRLTSNSHGERWHVAKTTRKNGLGFEFSCVSASTSQIPMNLI